MTTTPAVGAVERRTRPGTVNVVYRGPGDVAVFLNHNRHTGRAYVSAAAGREYDWTNVESWSHPDLFHFIRSAMQGHMPLPVLADALEESGLPGCERVAAVLRDVTLEFTDAR
jgi:hypothetical protein